MASVECGCLVHEVRRHEGLAISTGHQEKSGPKRSLLPRANYIVRLVCAAADESNDFVTSGSMARFLSFFVVFRRLFFFDNNNNIWGTVILP